MTDAQCARITQAAQTGKAFQSALAEMLQSGDAHEHFIAIQGLRQVGELLEGIRRHAESTTVRRAINGEGA